MPSEITKDKLEEIVQLEKSLKGTAVLKKHAVKPVVRRKKSVTKANIKNKIRFFLVLQITRFVKQYLKMLLFYIIGIKIMSLRLVTI